MTWIDTVPPSEASGLLEEVYAGVAGRSGSVANIIGCQSLHPEAMRDHYGAHDGDADLLGLDGHGDGQPDRPPRVWRRGRWGLRAGPGAESHDVDGRHGHHEALMPAARAIILILGLQISSLFVTVFQVLIPVSIALVLVTLAAILHRTDPALIA